MSVKEAVFPFIKFPGVDTVLGPEMKSTGEVMGIDATFGAAFAKAQIASGTLLPTSGSAFVSVPQGSYEAVVAVAQRLARAGFRLLATIGTGTRLRAAGLEVTILNKVQEGGPHIVDVLRRGEVALVINTPSGAESYRDSLPDPAHRARVPGAVLHDDRRGGGGGRGHRDHGARSDDGAPAPGALPIPMSPGDGPLAELLAALAPPLEYLAADGLPGSGPHRAAAAGARRSGSRACGSIRRPASTLRSPSSTPSSAALRDARPEDRASLLRRAHELLPALRDVGGAAP